MIPFFEKKASMSNFAQKAHVFLFLPTFYEINIDSLGKMYYYKIV